MVLRALKALGVVLGIPLLLVSMGVALIALAVLIGSWIGGGSLQLLFGPFGGC
jgi:hypothetical protein